MAVTILSLVGGAHRAAECGALLRPPAQAGFLPIAEGRAIAKSEATLSPRPDPLLGDMGRNWGWILALGLFYLVLGLVGLAMLFGLTFVNVLFIGVLMLAGGVAHMIETVKCKGWKGAHWHLAIAALYITGGLVVISEPELTSKLIKVVLGGVLAAVGLGRILIARQLQAKGAGWIWMLVSGVVAIMLAAMIATGWPLPGLFAIALFVAIELLLHGSSYVTLALTARCDPKDAVTQLSSGRLFNVEEY